MNSIIIHQNTVIIAKDIESRNWVLNGQFHLNQGFSLIPVRGCDLEDYTTDGSTISRIVSLPEVLSLKEDEFCTNKASVDILLVEIAKQQENK